MTSLTGGLEWLLGSLGDSRYLLVCMDAKQKGKPNTKVCVLRSLSSVSKCSFHRDLSDTLSFDDASFPPLP